MKCKNKVFCILIVMAFFVTIGLNNVYGYFFYDLESTYWGRNYYGDVTVQVTLHADGYSFVTTPQVTDSWLSVDKCWYGNNVTDRKTWSVEHPRGRVAKGVFDVKFGVPTSIGRIETSGTTKYLEIVFFKS